MYRPRRRACGVVICACLQFRGPQGTFSGRGSTPTAIDHFVVNPAGAELLGYGKVLRDITASDHFPLEAKFLNVIRDGWTRPSKRLRFSSEVLRASAEPVATSNRWSCLRYVRNLYAHPTFRISVGICPILFLWSAGSGRGDPLSPILFDVYINDILKACSGFGCQVLATTHLGLYLLMLSTSSWQTAWAFPRLSSMFRTRQTSGECAWVCECHMYI